VSTVLRPDSEPFAPPLPLILRWAEPVQPLPLRAVRTPPSRRSMRSPTGDAPRWVPTGPLDRPFDFCGHVRRLCADITARCDELRHVDVTRLLFAMTQARSGRRHGLQARVTPLRFSDGRLTRNRRGYAYQVQRYIVGEREMLYLVTFCLPRFLDQEFEDKFVTLFHELYHISPAFDGDLRRHHGRCQFHSHSKRRYDEQMAQLARAYLATRPDPSLHAFLRLNFAQLMERHGSVVGVVVPRPKLVPVAAARG
jgi:predicted metallopeptidase